MTRIGDVGLFIGMILIFGTQVVLNMTQYLGRFIQGSTSLHDYNNSDINFYRGDGEIRSVPASYVVARCNGGANTRFGTYSRGDDGRSWRIFSSDDVPSIFSKYSGDADSGNRWSFHSRSLRPLSVLCKQI